MTWHDGGLLLRGRLGHAAARLRDGRVLVVGGCVGDDPEDIPFADAEIWDEGRWSRAAPLLHARWLHTMVATSDGGALVLGGFDDSQLQAPRLEVERWDPAAHRWEERGKLRAAIGSLVPLADGSLLLLGRDIVRWDPAVGEGAVVAAAPFDTSGCAAVALPEDRAMVVGGYRARRSPSPDAAIWDARSDVWTLVGHLPCPRHAPTATLLGDGSVLVVGGYDYDANCTAADVDRWSPTQTLSLAPRPPGTFVRIAGMTDSRTMHTATLGADGKVLIAGGHQRKRGGGGGALVGVEIFDPAEESLSRGEPLRTPRRGHVAVTLDDGVMLLGGADRRGPVRSVEIWRAP